MKKLDIPLLMYRNIASVLRDIFTISPEEFRKQMDLLKKDYSIISLADLKDFLENDKDLPENSVVLGFDGNDRNLIDIGVPILKENDFHAIFFINPDTMGKSESEFSLEDIRYLLENDFEIGLNISPEINLSLANSPKKILQEQKGKLESALNTKIYHLSYSADPITNELLNQIKDSGFETAVSSRDLLNSKYLTSFDLSRRQITRKVNFGKFIKLLKSPSLSVCLIAKNEEKFIEKCLESIKDIADEIILVDTGSDDKTKEIASSYGAKIIDYKWQDDFSKARNIYLKNATKDWILSIDADETVEGRDGVKIRQLIEMDFDAFSFIQRTYSNEENDVNFVKSEQKDFSGYLSVPTTRLFRNLKGVYYEDAVHETIDASLIKNKAKLGNTDIAIHHYEILKGKDELKRKQLNYMEYSKKRLAENPKDVKALCDIGLAYFKFVNDAESAIPYLLKAKELDENYPRSYIILGEIYASLKKYEEAIPLYEKLIRMEPERKADNCYYLGQLYQALNEKEKAISAFNEALRLGCGKREDILRRLQQIS
jgi:glycosyltransferase involved in cell wall biosynthesis